MNINVLIWDNYCDEIQETTSALYSFLFKSLMESTTTVKLIRCIVIRNPISLETKAVNAENIVPDLFKTHQTKCKSIAMNTLSWNSFLVATGGSGLSLVSSSLRSEMRFTGGARQ